MLDQITRWIDLYAAELRVMYFLVVLLLGWTQVLRRLSAVHYLVGDWEGRLECEQDVHLVLRIWLSVTLPASGRLEAFAHYEKTRGATVILEGTDRLAFSAWISKMFPWKVKTQFCQQYQYLAEGKIFGRTEEVYPVSFVIPWYSLLTCKKLDVCLKVAVGDADRMQDFKGEMWRR